MNFELLLSSEDALNESVIWVDHREEEEIIIAEIAKQLAPGDHLTPLWDGEELHVTYNGIEQKIPLTISKHDRYVAISSIAKIIEEKYRIWLETESLGGDTHGILVLEKDALESIPEATRQLFLEKFTPLHLGQDYFTGIAIPYAGHENNNPNFEEDAKQHNATSEAMVKAITESQEFKNAMQDFHTEFGKLRRRSIAKVILTKTLRFCAYFVLIFIALRLLRSIASHF